MIKVNELRIGNCVKINNSYNECYVIAELLFDRASLCPVTNVDFNDYSAPVIYDNLKPIPLTEEILEKAGFEVSLRLDFNEWSLRYYDSVGVTLFLFDTPTSGVIKEKPSSWTNVTIKYLHQLQNLYYSLTGGELEIKL